MAFRNNYRPRLEALPRKTVGVGENDGDTILMLHMNGSDGSTTFTDACVGKLAHTVTTNGGAQIDTAQSKFGGSSGYFNGTDAYLSLGGHADFAFGTGDFTIDFWIRLVAYGTGYVYMYDSRPNVQGAYPAFPMDNTGKLAYYVSSAFRITATNAIPLDTWSHVCLSRGSSNTRIFLNGTQEGSTWADATNYLNGAGLPNLFRSGFPAFPEHPNCWIDQFRVSKVARWVSNFTPPNAPYERKITGSRQSYGDFQKFKLRRAA